MIQNKLEVRQVIHSLNEIEKLKLLLFDEDQYNIFEHIPKPYLIDATIASKIYNEENSEKDGLAEQKEGEKFSSMKSLGSRIKQASAEKLQQEFLMSNQSFWKKNLNRSKKVRNFSQALDNIKNKPELSIIDKRLLQIVNDFSSGVVSSNST